MRIQHLLSIAVACLLGAASITGQDLSDKVKTTYSLSPRPLLTATNVYSSPITGLAITMVNTTAPQKTYETIWYDSGLVFTHNPPLDPGQSYTFPVGPLSQAPNLQPHIWAVAFEDGRSFGDAQWLAELHARRHAAYEEIGFVTALLNQALANRESNDEIVVNLNGLKASLATSVADREPRLAAQFVTDWTAQNLKQFPGPAGAHVNMDPQERVPAIILPWLSRWSAALQRYDSTVK